MEFLVYIIENLMQRRETITIGKLYRWGRISFKESLSSSPALLITLQLVLPAYWCPFSISIYCYYR
jgi:hypothetical protein